MHTHLEGLGSLLEFLQEVENVSAEDRPSVVLESTGHYHSPVIQFLEEQNYFYIIVNPLISHQSQKFKFAKGKNRCH